MSVENGVEVSGVAVVENEFGFRFGAVEECGAGVVGDAAVCEGADAFLFPPDAVFVAEPSEFCAEL